MVQVEQLPLWDVLKKSKKVDDAQRAKVKQLIEHAAAILDRVIETFPTYTLHNSTHAVNVVHLMADLLGPQIKKLSPLEAAFLLLSAFYHDIGMVFSEEERNRLTEEPAWKSFLDEKPDAYIAVKKAEEVPLDIAEWYCRWWHADRVYVYLNRLPDELLMWGRTSIREELGEVCRSHNLDPAELHKLRTDFRGEADLRFCAVLLRLADILDFDRTRTPEAVYEYLGLARRSEPRASASDVEWRKHLCSEGFRFPAKRSDGYRLVFIAGPDEPGVEHDLREFLTLINGEIKQCRAVLSTCSEHWRSLPLPGDIDRSNLHGNGYRYGEYRFSLDQRQVIDLLMGENLYSEPYVFIRELIQNALDTSRHRRFIERAQGNPNFEPKPIQVRCWIDRDGYQWVRFDDDGMGMDEDIIRDHLLKVGSSYYRTANFQAEILRAQEKTNQNFVPISRFGIGLLSCFIAGDRVEISTLHRTSEGCTGVPIRLSLNGLHGFFTLQTPQLPPLSMPAPDKQEPGYRSEPGTSIAVRLDPTKEEETFHLEELLEKYVAYPPVPIEFSGKHIGGDPAAFIDKPWFERLLVTLSPLEMKSLERILRRKLKMPLQVEFLPIDLTRHTPTPELKGQLVLAVFRPTQEWLKLEKSAQRLETAISEDAYGSIQLIVAFRKVGANPSDVLFNLQAPTEKIGKVIDPWSPRSWLSHNGVSVPTSKLFLEIPSSNERSTVGWVRGIVSLTDSLRPEVSVSREQSRNLPWRFYSAANLAIHRALSSLGEDLRSRPSECLHMDHQSFLLKDLLEDTLLHTDEGWASIPILRTSEGMRTVHEARDTAEHGSLRITFPESDFLHTCGSVLVQLRLNASVIIDDTGRHLKSSILVSSGPPQLITEGHTLFPPLTFLPFHNSILLRAPSSRMYNSDHPFSAWLLQKAPAIAKRYPGLFERLRSELLLYRFGNEELDRLNGTLDRLRELHPSVHPPQDLVLK